MESHCTHTRMLTRSQTKSDSGGNKLKTQLAPDKTDACHMLVKKTESVKKKLSISSSEKIPKRQTSPPKQSIAGDSVITCKPLDKTSSKYNSTTVHTTSTMNNITTDKETEVCKISVNKKTEVARIPKKRKWTEENESNGLDEIFEENKTSEKGVATVNNEELLKNKPYVLLTPIREVAEFLINTDMGIKRNNMNHNSDSRSKAFGLGKESVHSCEELETSSMSSLTEPQISRKSCMPYDSCHKTDEFAIEMSYENNFESRFGNNMCKVLLEEADSDFNELHEKHETRNSVKCKQLRDEVESKTIKITKHISPMEKDTENNGEEDVTCQNKFKVDNALNKVGCHIQITDEFRKCGVGSLEKEKTEKVIDNIENTDTHKIYETELSENRKQEVADTMHISEDHTKLGLTQENPMGDVPDVNTHKKCVSESCKNEKEPCGVTQVEDNHKTCGEENQKRSVSNKQLVGSHRKVWTQLSEGIELETPLSSLESTVNECSNEHSKKNVVHNKLLSEDSDCCLLEFEFCKSQKEKLHSENNTSVSANEVKQIEVNTEIWGNELRDVAACDVENSETNKLLNETDLKVQDIQSSSDEGYERNNEESYSSIKSTNLNTGNLILPRAIQTNTEEISLFEEKCRKCSEENSSVSLPTASKTVNIFSTDQEKHAVSDKDSKNSEVVINSEVHLRNIDLRNIDIESQLHKSEVCNDKQFLCESNNTCNMICYSLTEKENSEDDNRKHVSKHDKNKNTEAGKMNKCCIEKWGTVQVNIDNAVGEQKRISLAEEDSRENASVEYKSVTEVSNEINNQSQCTMDSLPMVESNQWVSDYNTEAIPEKQTDMLKAVCYKTNNNLNSKIKFNPFELDKGVVSNNVGEKALCGGNVAKLSFSNSSSSSSSSSSDVMIKENKDVAFKLDSKLFCNSKQSSDNNYFIKGNLSQTTFIDHEKFQRKLQTCVQQAQGRNDINSECPKTENSGFEHLINESIASCQTGENIMPCHHYSHKNILHNKTMCYCHEELGYSCTCHKDCSNHCSVCKHSENIVESCVIPSVVSTVANYFHTVGLNGKHVQTLTEQVQKNIRSVVETIQHTNRIHALPSTLFINKKQKNKKKKNKRKKKNENINMHLKQGKNLYLKKLKQQNDDKGNIMKGTENNQHSEHERKKIKCEINEVAKAEIKQIKNTASDPIFKSVPHDLLSLSGSEKAQTARSRQMSGDNIRREECYRSGTGQDTTQKNSHRIKRKRYASEQLRPIKVMKLEKKITSGKNVFSVCRSDNTRKDENRRNRSKSVQKVRKVKHKFTVDTVNVSKDNHESYRQPTFRKNSSFTVCGSDNVRKDTVKPEYAESLKKVNEAQQKFKVETINVPKDKHVSSCKLTMFQKDSVLPVCGNNNIIDDSDKTETKKDIGLKHKFSVVESKLKSSSGKFTFQLGNKRHEKGILEPIRPYDKKSKEYLSALQEIKSNQTSTAGSNIFHTSTKSKISEDKSGVNKRASSTNVENRETSVKRFPEELLNSVTQSEMEKKGNGSKRDLSHLHVKLPKHKKKLKLKSAVLEDGYIPLNTNSATQFAVARLDKKTTFSAVKDAAQFKQNCLYGPHIKRAPDFVMSFSGTSSSCHSQSMILLDGTSHCPQDSLVHELFLLCYSLSLASNNYWCLFIYYNHCETRVCYEEILSGT